MKDIKIEKCQYCGSEEFIEARIDSSYGGAYASTGGFRNAVLYVLVCRNCGSVVRTYCKDPEKLYPKKERRE